MKSIQLNIGLAVTGQATPLRLSDVQTALAYEGLIITRSRVAQSATEPTLCCECAVEAPELFNPTSAIYALAVTLQQEAIAWRTDSGHGFVTGPQARQWGAFDPAQFLPVVDPQEIDGWTRERFLSYLTGQLIPDLEAAGMEATAEDFSTAVKFLQGGAQ